MYSRTFRELEDESESEEDSLDIEDGVMPPEYSDSSDDDDFHDYFHDY